MIVVPAGCCCEQATRQSSNDEGRLYFALLRLPLRPRTWVAAAISHSGTVISGVRALYAYALFKTYI